MKRIRKKRNPDWKKVLYGIFLNVTFLGFMRECAMPAYGFDAVVSYNTGGFDMDIGEGTGELPGNWDTMDTMEDQSPDAEENPTEADRDTTDVDSSVGAENEADITEDVSTSEVENGDGNNFSENNGQEDNTPGDSGMEAAESYEYQESDSVNGNAVIENGNDNIQTEEADEIWSSNEMGRNSSQESDNSIMLTIPETPKPPISFMPKPTLSPEPAKKVSTIPKISPKIKDHETDKQNMALSYYQTGEKNASSSDKEKDREKCPSFQAGLQGDKICIKIGQDDPVQILSFRLNGKECNWCWQGKVFQAEVPKGTGKDLKAELLVYVRSGKLYHKILRLR